MIGLFAAPFESSTRSVVPFGVRQFMPIGLSGGFTTFSTFSLQTLVRLDAGEAGRAVRNAARSIILCLIAVGLGYKLPNALGAVTRSMAT
ncbi:hypothetical protein GCM10017643_47160 [Ancylobacter dichloromethanicus]|uniref:Fluoride-specific ion channel n=1 Tax=Ancylobacter dichloromethanicus TaxID=518825 RepID=A0A9W6JE27_9HYPH|nr:CrcB family protein [Ancylobacter dichloromethanicus]GLK74598.1 hypothetical protein GCM10017643_47160 [Ancylobacter dichloromethanicus]